ncbi:MAG: hypothetical protein KDA69_09945 [Planctomycetaceae bacterium]|nr:hypothetical protein [Planctomycetaceae bacterium]
MNRIFLMYVGILSLAMVATSTAQEPLKLGKPRILEGSAGRVLALAISPDGQLLASGGYDVPGDESRGHAVRIWDLKTFKQLRLIRYDGDSINTLAFDPAGKRVAVGSRDGATTCLDVATGQQIMTTSGTDSEVETVLYSSDGKQIFVGRDQYYAFDATNGKLLAAAKTHNDFNVSCMTLSPDGKFLFAGISSDVAFVSLQKMLPVFMFGAHDQITAVALSSDQKLGAAGCYDGTVYMWDLVKKQLLFRGQMHSKPVTSIAFANENRHLISGGDDGKISVLNLKTEKQEQVLEASTLAVDALIVSPDGRFLINNDILKIQVREIFGDGAARPSNSPEPKSAVTKINLNTLDAWEIGRGEWQEKGGRIIGTGNSRINSKQTFPNDFTFRCKLRVNGPTNPRIRFGSFHFGYEGEDQLFFLHGSKATGTRFPFKFGQVYQIEVTMQGEETVLKIDGNEVARSNPKVRDDRTFALEGGGVRSQSSAEFFDIQLEIPKQD